MVYSGIRKSERKRRAEETLKDVGLEDRVEHKPNELSGGQRQRVAIARALVNKPALLLADEPTGNLDSKISEEIMKLFADIHSKGNTLVMVTHEEDIGDACTPDYSFKRMAKWKRITSILIQFIEIYGEEKSNLYQNRR